ncbi:hypothetical protein BH10PLA1_BH10PLA1_13300 [soil metagenome]
MPKRKPEILNYAAAPHPWYARADFYRVLFWPITFVLFVAIVLLEAGVGWASAVLQLLTSFVLMLAWLLAGYGWGAIVRSLVKIEGRSPLVRVTTLAAGLGIMSLLILGLGLLGWMNQPVSHVMLMIGAGGSLYRIVRCRATIHARVDFVHWWWMLLIPLASLNITAAMLPAGILWGGDEPNGYDVVEYHLQVPREWFEAGKIIPLHHNVFSFFPFNVEMHYLLAMHTMGGPWVAQFLAQMMHAAFIGLTIAAVYAAVCERGKLPAIMAALFAASAPWMPMLGAIAYNEGGLLLYGTLAIAWAMKVLQAATPSPGTAGEGGDEGFVAIGKSTARLQQSPHSTLSHSTVRGTEWRSLAIAGVMAGFACGCKLTAVPILLVGLPSAITAVLILQRGFFAGASLRRWLMSMSLFGACGLAVFSPWLIRNYAWAGNPVFPEQQKLLGRAHFSQMQSDRFYKAHKARPDQQAMSVRAAELWRQVFADWRFGYALLPLGAIALLVTIRRRESKFLLLMLVGLTAFWLIATHLQGRFYVLAIPISGIAAAQLSQWRALPWLIGLATIAVVAANYEVQLQLFRFGESRRFEVMETVGWKGMDKSEEIESPPSSSPQTIVLIGDAAAFWYQTPMSRLHYRTVFDVDAGANGSAIEAWTAGLPAGEQVLLSISWDEVNRLNRSYGTPLVQPIPQSGPGAIPFTIPQASTSPPALPSISRPVPASAPSP